MIFDLAFKCRIYRRSKLSKSRINIEFNNFYIDDVLRLPLNLSMELIDNSNSSNLIFTRWFSANLIGNFFFFRRVHKFLFYDFLLAKSCNEVLRFRSSGETLLVSRRICSQKLST